MPTDAFSSGATLVMAHPDDEALWASSILTELDRIILCFEGVSSQPAWSMGRRRSLESFPIPGAMSLGLEESEVFNSASWPMPIETNFGLSISLQRHSLPHISISRYKQNYDRLLRLLRPLLSDAKTVVTHNPWGEYGHEEHIQVFRAVAELKREFNFSLWFTNYVSNKSYALMLCHLPAIRVESPPMPTNTALADQLKALYQDNDCWTWLSDYTWPKHERFWKWSSPEEKLEGSDELHRAGTVLETNTLWLDWVPPRKPRLPFMTNLIRHVRPRRGN